MNIIKKIFPDIESSGESSGESSQKILNLMSKNKNITIPEPSKQIGIGSRAIEKQIARLKKNGLIKRVGSTKAGYWKIV